MSGMNLADTRYVLASGNPSSDADWHRYGMHSSADIDQMIAAGLDLRLRDVRTLICDYPIRFGTVPM
jgi:hypothetical protein